jgi:hypothetical protein
LYPVKKLTLAKKLYPVKKVDLGEKVYLGEKVNLGEKKCTFVTGVDNQETFDTDGGRHHEGGQALAQDGLELPFYESPFRPKSFRTIFFLIIRDQISSKN